MYTSKQTCENFNSKSGHVFWDDMPSHDQMYMIGLHLHDLWHILITYQKSYIYLYMYNNGAFGKFTFFLRTILIIIWY